MEDGPVCIGSVRDEAQRLRLEYDTVKVENDARYHASKHDSAQAGVKLMEARRSAFILSFVSYDDATAKFGDQLVDRRVL